MRILPTMAHRVLALLTGLAMILAGLVVLGSTAVADSSPVDPTNPATPPTVTADALPTVQVNGVVWQQVVVGDIVYVAGNFTTARPPGAAPGTNTTPRNHTLAFRLSTGALITDWAPRLNAQAITITASPDGTRIYVGGAFTTVDGATAYRVAAINAVGQPNQGKMITSFRPVVNTRVNAIVATASVVYLGGWFSGLNSSGRSKAGAVNASDGSTTAWNPLTAGGDVLAMRMSPDGSRMVLGGNFTSMNGSSNPGYGLASVDTGTGRTNYPMAVNSVVRDAGANGAILSLSGDANYVYGTGYDFGTGANFEGAFSAAWGDGKINWIEDCHGDSYGVAPIGNVVYVVSHAHYCGNVGGFPQTNPWTYYYAKAFSRQATGTVTRDPLGYPNFEGNPAPTLQNWFPSLSAGSFTGQYQAAWTVTGNSQYVVLGGEFPRVNGVAQQGLVRLAVKELAPNARGPVLSGGSWVPTVQSPSSGTARIDWQTNHDQDNKNLTYRVVRDGAVTVTTVSRESTFWQRPTLSFTDSGLAPGSTHSYQVIASDPFGRQASSATASVTVAGTPTGNTPPTASFTVSATGLTASVNGSASSDPNGTISSYAWNFGDGQTGSGVSTSHTYAAAGTYTITLTVTDNAGATGSTSRQVSVTAGGVQLQVHARDAFERAVTSGFGRAEVGGDWSVWGSSGTSLNVSAGRGNITHSNGGSSGTAHLRSVATNDADLWVKLSLDKVTNGGGSYLSIVGRDRGTSGDYRAKVVIGASGAVSLQVSRVSGGETVLGSANPGLTYVPGDELQLRLRVTGQSPTTTSAKIWKVGTAEPAAWQINAQDSTAALQGTGAIGFSTYLSGSATNLPVTVRYNDLLVQTTK
ncbi:PKD domain-containing protein [Arthrobacter rhizosphaerae]|uniref:PKD domain-containing protein n=1 Tax=Arthrobacter rhizosphaerae TaxID=2855490 RepID=UPI001FF378D0|nr:PKD domain-containing protein [Arthrobacter rhizosphaerae]